MLQGRCFCGAATYEVADEFLYAAYCHCSNCRRTTGSAFKPFAGIERDKFTVTSLNETLLIYGSHYGHDAHCSICEALLYSLVRDAAYIHVAMGTLVDAPSIVPSEHIFVGSKAPWFIIGDGLPQWEEHSGASARLA